MFSFFENKTLDHFYGSGKDFWRFYEKFIKTKKSIDSKSPSSILDIYSGKVVYETIEIANTFNHHFTNISLPSDISDCEAESSINKNFSD